MSGPFLELSRRLSSAAALYRSSRDEQDLAVLESLARDAATHVRQAGSGTVDHIVLSGVLKPITDEIPSVGKILEEEKWRWVGKWWLSSGKNE